MSLFRPRTLPRLALSLPTLLLAAALAAAERDAGGDKPVLEVEGPIYDWGQAYQGEVVEHSFVLKNSGTGRLVVFEVKPACSCTVAGGKEKRELAPGESTELLLRLDTSTLKGEVKKETEISTNAEGDSKVWMQGEVIELLKLEPSAPKVEVVRRCLDPQRPLTVSISPALGKEVAIRSVKALKGLLKPELREETPGKKYELKLLPSLGEKDSDAFQTESLELETSVDGKALVLRAQVSILVKERIEVRPSRSIYIHRKETEGFDKPGAPPISRDLELWSLGGEKHTFRVTGASSRSGSFRAQVEAIEVGKAYRIRLTLEGRPKAEERLLKDVIEVQTDDPEVPRITIPALAQF